jgi:hypothetical protein
MRNSRTSFLLAFTFLCASAAWAQDGSAPPSDPNAIESAPLPDAAVDAPNTTGPVDQTSHIAVGDINVFDGEPVGLSTDSVLGVDMWSNAPRNELETLLNNIPVASRNPTIANLARRLLLTTSESPVGSGKRALVTIRIEKLMSVGMLDEAAELASKARLKNDPDFSRVATNVILLAGRTADACGDATAARLTENSTFWIELRTYCYAVAGDQGQVELMDQLLDAQGQADEAYRMLRDDVVQHLNYAPGPIAEPTALHVFLFKAAGLPVPQELIAKFHLNPPPALPDNAVGAGFMITPDQIDFAASAFASAHNIDPAAQRHGALVIGLADTLGVPLPENVQSVMPQLRALMWPGGRPSASEMQNILAAATQQGRRGEALLRLIISLDSRDLPTLAPDATIFYVHMLQQLGFITEAREIAAQAMLQYRDVPPPPPPAPVQ